MLKVIYFIDLKKMDIHSLVYDPNDNELIDPKTGDSWILFKASYKFIFEAKPTSDYKFIIRTF